MPRQEPGARAAIRAANAAAGCRIVVLDADPTGSQAMHDARIVTVLDEREYTLAMARPSTSFVLTNTRGLAEPDAVAVTTDVATSVLRHGAQLGVPVRLVSRSDSTLRGHVIAEVAALRAVRRRVTGRDYRGVLLVPAYFEAGRYTEGDVHWAVMGGRPVPVGETEFARDATFGYTSSNLREFVAERSGGRVAAADVVSVSLDDIRVGGPRRVAEILRGVTDGRFVVVNATGYADLEIVVLGLAGMADDFLFRTGPSFVRALSGVDPIGPVTAATVWPGGRPAGHGLVVVGSHVGQTSRQLAVARERGALAAVEVDAAALADPDRAAGAVSAAAGRVAAALAGSDVVLFTSRDLITGDGAADSLAIARAVSAGVADVVARVVAAARPVWVVAKGGITSHDVAVRGLGMRRATVLGQVFAGMVSVFAPVAAAPAAMGVPYVVFAGNVGDERALADVVDLLAGR
jgi:uncharacterized protein YgbK (DUF1537 family)